MNSKESFQNFYKGVFMKPSRLLLSTTALLGLALSASLSLAAPPAPAPLTENQIVGLINTANNAEIEAGKVASSKAQKQEVKDFAAKMVVDHTASNVAIDALEVKSGLKREESETSKELKKTTDDMVDNLKNAKDADFDRAYIDAQVKMHQELLTALDQTLIPAAKNADLKAFLTDKRATVEAHLNLAKQIQAGLATP
jgi:putative membrane protein